VDLKGGKVHVTGENPVASELEAALSKVGFQAQQVKSS
jgi:hypothetical protein